jgi:hypothetical protein
LGAVLEAAVLGSLVVLAMGFSGLLGRLMQFIGHLSIIHAIMLTGMGLGCKQIIIFISIQTL